MKILRLVDYGYEVGGVENGIVITNEILRQRGHDVRVISSDAQLKGVRFSDYEFSTIPRALTKRVLYNVFNLSAYRAMRKVVSDFDPDIVLLHTMHQSSASVLYLLKMYPTALFVHGPEIYTKTLLPWHLAEGDFRHGEHNLKDLTFVGRLHYFYFRYICGIFYKFGLRNVDEVVALSGYTKNFLQEEGIDASYIPNGVRLWPRSTGESCSPIIFSAGRLEDYKGIDDLIRAMPEILRTVPDAVLRIAGHGSYEGSLKTLVKDLKVGKSVKFVGHLNQQQMYQSYNNCTIFIMPSVWPETFGKVGVEAMSVGRPVIATDVGGVTDWLIDGQNGFLVKPHRPDQIAAKATTLLTDCKLTKKMSQSARLTSLRFSDTQMATNIEGLARLLKDRYSHKIRRSKDDSSAEDSVGLSSTKKRIAVSVIAQMMSQVFMGAIGVVILKIMTNTLGVESYGIYATIFTFVSTFTLLTDLGLNTITAREVAKNPTQAGNIISHNMGLRLALCVIAIPVISGLGLIIYPSATTSLRVGILIMSCYLFFDAVWSTSATYFIAKVRSDIPAMISAGQQVLFLLAVVGVSVLGCGLYGYIASFVLTSCMGAVFAVYFVRRYIKVLPRGNLDQWKKYIGLSLTFGIISIINTIYLRADSIMLSVLAGTTAVGIYGVAYSLINTFTYLSGYIMTGLTPSMAVSKGSELGQIVQKAFHFMTVFACLMVITGFVVRHDIIQSVSSKAFASAATPFAILVSATAFSYLYSVFGFASVAVNKHHKIVFVSAGSLLLNVGINFFLIPRYGIVGAACATLVSEFVALVAVYLIFQKETGVTIKFSIITKPAISALAVLALSTLIKRLWSTPSALYNTIIAVTIMSVAYFMLLYVLDGLPLELRSMIDRIFNLAREFRDKKS